MPVECTVYKRPHGHTKQITITKVRSDDAAWFNENDARLSIEDCGSGLGIVIYADVGLKVDDDPDEDPDEIIVMANDRSCEDALHDLRIQCEHALMERSRHD